MQVRDTDKAGGPRFPPFSPHLFPEHRKSAGPAPVGAKGMMDAETCMAPALELSFTSWETCEMWRPAWEKPATVDE